MTDTVRIMPRQPIEAKRDEFGEGYYTERGTSIILRDYLNSGGVGWVEVSAPIVWDGTKEALDAIAAALPSGSRVAGAPTNNKLPMYINLGRGDSVRVPVGWRIQIVGNSFVILPPEVTA